MVYFYQLFLNTGDVILKLYTSLSQKANVLWSTVCVTLEFYVMHVLQMCCM